MSDSDDHELTQRWLREGWKEIAEEYLGLTLAKRAIFWRSLTSSEKKKLRRAITEMF